MSGWECIDLNSGELAIEDAIHFFSRPTRSFIKNMCVNVCNHAIGRTIKCAVCTHVDDDRAFIRNVDDLRQRPRFKQPRALSASKVGRPRPCLGRDEFLRDLVERGRRVFDRLVVFRVSNRLHEPVREQRVEVIARWKHAAKK